MLSTTVETITPAIAEKWLANNPSNRKLKEAAVEAYTAQMRADRWLLNGEALVFDISGALLNGQHRLTACVKAGASFSTVVVRGVERSAFTTMDTGSRRSANDVLGMQGFANVNPLASTARTVINYRRGSPLSNAFVSNDDISAFVQEHPRLVEIMTALRGAREMRRFATPVAATLFLGSTFRADAVPAFIEKFSSGASLAPGDPVLALRSRYLSTAPRQQRDAVGRFAAAVLAWNAHAQGRTLQKLYWRGDAFPQIVGA
jgi:hypothetical protein